MAEELDDEDLSDEELEGEDAEGREARAEGGTDLAASIDVVGYQIGYRKPPRHTQFRPGQSGNPRGRKKGSRGLKTDLHTELNRVLEVKMGSYRFKGTSQQLMLRGLALLAANGNLKASAQLVPLILTVFGVEDRGADKRSLSAHDQATLDSFLTAFGGEAFNDEPSDQDAEPATGNGSDGANDHRPSSVADEDSSEE